MLTLLAVCAALCAGVSGTLAPFISPCHSSDGACMRESAQRAVPVLAAGVPALGLSALDPMHVARVTANQAGLDMDFRNTSVKGLRNCAVLGIKRHGHKITLELKCSATLIGDYTLSGHLLIMPINGDGKYKIKIRDIVVKIQFEVDTKMVNGEKHWSVTSWRHTAHVLTNVQFHFQNLFRGDQQLSNQIHQFANSNWGDIFKEVAPPIVKAIVGNIVDEIQKLFGKVPVKDLALD